MNLPTPLPTRLVPTAAIVGLLLQLLTPVDGQTAISPAGAANSTNGPAITLSPFEVEASRDDHSYTTLNSNSVTGFNVPLSKLPLSADILDETFMKDVGVDDLNTLIRNYAAGASYEGSGTGATAYATSDNGIESGDDDAGWGAPARSETGSWPPRAWPIHSSRALTWNAWR
jgi:hypothetical protein